MKIKIFKKNSEFIKETIDFIISLNAHSVALSGGNTPKEIYKKLSKIPEINKRQFFQVDERYVPANHPDSNQKMIRETLKPKNFHYFDTSLPIEKSLQKYSKELPKTFDLTILGIGPDGHTASLFPNSKKLSSKKTVIHTTIPTQDASAQREREQVTRPKDGQPPLNAVSLQISHRLTITFPTILKSKNILVLLKNKAKIIKELQNPTKSKENFPALKLLEHKNLQIFALQN